jgi:FdhD protein
MVTMGLQMARSSVVPIPVRTIQTGSDEQRLDLLAVEEPLEIRLSGKTISITMRTPGHDLHLAAGFLFGEGLLESPQQIVSSSRPSRNSIDIHLKPGTAVDLERLERNFYMSSSCGVCGKASLEALELAGCPMLPKEAPTLSAEMIYSLPETLRQSQSVFEQTGGLHAAALFDFTGRLQAIREDVGRHNALDKLIGAEFLAGRTPLHHRLLLLSGRTSFELIQKSLMAGIPVVVAVGAPSSLAVELALRFRMTLIGFVRNRRFNVYSGAARIVA